jgi:hypothetical protein
MGALSIYEEIDVSIGRCTELVEAMLAYDMNYSDQEIKSFANQYKWTVKNIIFLCETALKNPLCGSPDIRSKTKKILLIYKSMDDIIES